MIPINNSMTRVYPEMTIDDRVKCRIWERINQKMDKFRAGKLSDTYMRKYLVQNTTLNLFEINKVVKLMKKSKNDLYKIFCLVRPFNPMGYTYASSIIDTSNPDYKNFRKKYEKKDKQD